MDCTSGRSISFPGAAPFALIPFVGGRDAPGLWVSLIETVGEDRRFLESLALKSAGPTGRGQLRARVPRVPSTAADFTLGYFRSLLRSGSNGMVPFQACSGSTPRKYFCFAQSDFH